MLKVDVQAPAKLNLALEVTGFAENGYHTIDMIMQSISLFERVEITKSRAYSLRCPGSLVPANDKNTATKAARAFFRETGLLAGADITVHKAVPTRAGMAGGSADAAAVLVGLNELYAAKLSNEKLCEIGLLVGADVPFSIMGGTARVGGIGEILQQLRPLPDCWFAIAMPKDGVSTPAAYARFDEIGTKLRPNINCAVKAIEMQDLKMLCQHMQNALEHANSGEKTEILRKTLDDAGALASMMTGSGAAVFGLFDDEQKARFAAKKMQSIVQKVFVAQPVQQGAMVL